jgi:hypothetical protein
VTDRSLRADQLAHARRTNPQPDDARLAEIRAYASILSASGPDTEGGRLDWLLACVDQLTTALVRAGIVRADDTPAEMLEHIAATGEQVNAITWGTTCLSCARVLDGSIQETERAEKAEAAIARVREYCTLLADASRRVAARETAQDVIRLLDGNAVAEVIVDRSSVGSPEVKAVAALTPPEDVQRILQRVREAQDADWQPGSVPGITPCRTTTHCANWGFCHRCAPEFAVETLRLFRAAEHDEENGSEVYAAIIAQVAADAYTPLHQPIPEES